MYRISKGITQKEFGTEIGVTFQQVQKYETGTNRIGASRLAQIAETLSMPVENLFTGRDSGGMPDKKPLGTEVMRFLATKDGKNLAYALAKVKDPATRHAIITLINILAEAKE